jgi:hypothetical protein
MRRTKKTLWFLLLLQAAPFLLAVAGASGVLDPLGALAIRSIPLPGPGEQAGFVIDTARFLIAHWFFGCLWLMSISSLVAVLYVAFDKALTKLERLAWALSFVLGQPVTVILYCVLGLLGSHNQRQASVA